MLEVVEHEWNLDAVAGLEAGGRLPIELIDIGWPALIGAPFRHAKAADPKDLARFPDLKLVSIDDPLFGGWAKAQPKHFGEGGIFDQIYQPKSTN